MSGLAVIIGLLLAGVTVFLIGYPLISKEEEEKSLDRSLDFDSEDALERQKESVFTTLGEIEFDYRMKKLSEDDYDNLKDKYKRQAVALLKAEESDLDMVDDDLDVLEKELELEVEQEIEREVQEMLNKDKERN